MNTLLLRVKRVNLFLLIADREATKVPSRSSSRTATLKRVVAFQLMMLVSLKRHVWKTFLANVLDLVLLLNLTLNNTPFAYSISSVVTELISIYIKSNINPPDIILQSLLNVLCPVQFLSSSNLLQTLTQTTFLVL